MVSTRFNERGDLLMIPTHQWADFALREGFFNERGDLLMIPTMSHPAFSELLRCISMNVGIF